MQSMAGVEAPSGAHSTLHSQIDKQQTQFPARKRAPYQRGLLPLARNQWDQIVGVLLQAREAHHHPLAVVLELRQGSNGAEVP